MSLISFKSPPILPTGTKGSGTQPIYEGAPTVEIMQEQRGTGFFGWLDNVGATIGDAAGRAVDVVADDWISDLTESNSGAVKTPDTTPAKADNQLPVDTSFLGKNKQYIIWGGAALFGVTALILAFKK